MAKFKYKFKSIKEIKERLEKKTQKELSIIDLEIAKNKEKITELNKLVKKGKIKMLNQDSIKVSELHFYSKYESYLLSQIELLQKHIQEKKIERQNKLNELVQKSKETKTFEKLEEKHFTEFVKEQDKIEQNELDEIAVQKFIKE